MIGSRIGADIKITATGGRKNPATSKNTLMIPISTQRFTSSSAIQPATDCVTNRDDSMKENTPAAPMMNKIITLSRVLSRSTAHSATG
jgi:hypothetical protein